MLWVIALGMGAVLYGANITNARNCNHAADQIGATINSRLDLVRVRDALSLSMQLAMLVIGLYLLTVTLWIVLIAYTEVTLMQSIAPGLLFGLGTLPAGMISKPAEDRIKKLDVDPTQPELQEVFSRILKMQKTPRFGIPKDVVSPQ